MKNSVITWRLVLYFWLIGKCYPFLNLNYRARQSASFSSPVSRYSGVPTNTHAKKEKTHGPRDKTDGQYKQSKGFGGGGFGPGPGSGSGTTRSSSRDASTGGRISGQATNTRNSITEEAIQMKIGKIPGLRESMVLEDEIHRWDESYNRMSLIDQALVPQRASDTIQTKRSRLAQLREDGWTTDKVRNTLHEATWDATAESRHQRHQTTEISSDMKSHMLAVAKWALEPLLEPPIEPLVSPISSFAKPTAAFPATAAAAVQQERRLICDVGCGTGILISFLQEYAKTNKAAASFGPAAVLGVDLSGGMLSVASRAYPDATFQQIDFMRFEPPEDTKFSAVVMNECLHNFGDVSAAIRHAAGMLADGGRLVVSHPKGFDNVVMQSSRNRLLVPSRLPTGVEFKALVETLNKDFQGALGLRLRVLLEPDTRSGSPHYLAVLVKEKLESN